MQACSVRLRLQEQVLLPCLLSEAMTQREEQQLWNITIKQVNLILRATFSLVLVVLAHSQMENLTRAPKVPLIALFLRLLLKHARRKTSLERDSDGSLSALQVEKTNPDGSIQTETIKTHTMILATGHSSRDTYVMLKDKGISMERKTFAMGVRIEHLQSQINKSLYGPEATNPVLGAAPYKLSVHLPSGRSAFSFCMCPGGYVVSAASEKNGVVTNGMSLSDRAGKNANSGFLANVYPEDLPGDDVLAGIELQRSCEQAAYKAGGGDYVAPAQLVGDFLNKKASSGPRSVKPTYPRGVTWTSLEDCLPPYILQTLREALPVMDKKLHGFAHPDAVLTGVETRSSSPVRITRDETGQSVNTPGIWPIGEGAGYAGGIMSAAADGIRMAELIVERYNNA